MNKETDIKTRLSTLWIVVMFNMVFADIFSIMVELVKHDILQIPGDVKTVMAIAAIVTNIPILMIFFSRALPFRLNRMANIIAAMVTIIYIIGGGDTSTHYLIIAGIEIICLVIIIITSWQWKELAKEMDRG